jgi:hypothetical protein
LLASFWKKMMCKKSNQLWTGIAGKRELPGDQSTGITLGEGEEVV